MNQTVEKPVMRAVNVLIVKQEEKSIFCIRRSLTDKYFPGMYACPGGEINEGENLDTAIKREFLEETGYELTSSTDVILELIADLGKFILHIRLVEGEMGNKITDTIDNDIIEVGWVSYDTFFASIAQHHYPTSEIQKLRDYLGIDQ